MNMEVGSNNLPSPHPTFFTKHLKSHATLVQIKQVAIFQHDLRVMWGVMRMTAKMRVWFKLSHDYKKW